MIASELQPTITATTTLSPYEFVWQSEVYFEGNIQFWSVVFISTVLSGISGH